MDEDQLDLLFHALASQPRREILDVLKRQPGCNVGFVAACFSLSRIGVMKHLEVLRQAQLVSTREEGRQRVNSLNVVPIRQIYERWVGPFQELWSGELLQIKELAEGNSDRTKRKHKSNVDS